MLEGSLDPVEDALTDAHPSDGTPTDQLVKGDRLVCWTCGSNVARDRIAATLDTLQTVRQEYLDDIQAIETELDELRERQQELESQRGRRTSFEQNLEDTKQELEERQKTLEELRETREQFNKEIEMVEQEVSELESEDFSDVLDLHKEANQLEFELERLESDLDDVTDWITAIEDRLAEEDALREQREELRDALHEQRTRIERIERDVVDAFNTHMDEVLDMLEYDNLARIWLDRVETTVREGRRTTDKTVFDLHIVRTTDTGVTYEDTIDHLSESEREVTGLIFALSGFLVHEVYQEVPFMLMDSLEAIDAERLSKLVEYFDGYAEHVVVALLPEDAQAISTAEAPITDI